MAAMISIEVEVTNDSGETSTHTLEFKSLAEVPIGLLRKTRGDQQEQMWVVFEWALSPEQLAVFDGLPASELDPVLIQMQKASGVELGES